MNIKYNKQKSELKEDPVLESFLKAKEYIQKNSKPISIGLVVLGVLIGIVVFNYYYQKSKIKNAREEFGAGMVAYSEQKLDEAIDKLRTCAENYRGTEFGTMSAYMIGNILYEQKRFDEAISWYEISSKGKRVEFVNSQAIECLAACYEAKGDTALALKNLEIALKDNNLTHRRSAIKWKIALLTKGKDTLKTIRMCDEILSDTLAQAYHNDAKFLKAMFTAKTKS